ncbi:hypothetical protein D3C80_2042790 [compost metagenome]
MHGQPVGHRAGRTFAVFAQHPVTDSPALPCRHLVQDRQPILPQALDRGGIEHVLGVSEMGEQLTATLMGVQ